MILAIVDFACYRKFDLHLDYELRTLWYIWRKLIRYKIMFRDAIYISPTWCNIKDGLDEISNNWTANGWVLILRIARYFCGRIRRSTETKLHLIRQMLWFPLKWTYRIYDSTASSSLNSLQNLREIFTGKLYFS